MPYTHPDDNNLKNLHKAMQYSDSQEPELRVNIGEGIDISGTVNIPGNLTIDNFPAIHPVLSFVILSFQYIIIKYIRQPINCKLF